MKRELRTANVDQATTGRHTIIEGRFGQVVRIRGAFLATAAKQTITLWRGSEKWGGSLVDWANNPVFTLPMTAGEDAWLDLPMGEGLDIEQSADVQLSGFFRFEYV